MDDASAREEAELARRARLGDRDAFAELYRRFARGVHAVLAARVRVHEADDLVQEVFLRAWAARADLRDPERVGAWLCAIARRVAHAARAGRVALEALPEHLPAHESHEAAAGEEAEHVLNVLRSLPESYRETLALRLLGGYSGLEIARLSGLTHGSLRVNLHRGMELLRERLAREEAR